MPNVTVNPSRVVTVKINQRQQSTVTGATTFVGAGDVTAKVEAAYLYANTALIIAQQASDTANTKYDKVGGEIYGDVIIDGNITAVNEVIDGGEFL